MLGGLFTHYFSPMYIFQQLLTTRGQLTWGHAYQYIKILTCVCVCLCVTEVGWSWGGTRLVMHDLRTSTSNSAMNVRTLGMAAGTTSRCNWGGSRNRRNRGVRSSGRSGRNRGAAAEADASGEHEKRTQSGSSGWSGRKWGAAVEADRCNREQQHGADAIGEQQLCTESCSVPSYSSSRRRTKGK